MGSIIIVIPAYKPEKKMLFLLKELRKKVCASGNGSAVGSDAGKGNDIRIGGIVVVDDGGGEEFHALFAQAEEIGCRVVHHTVNRGKGAAIRTGIQAATELYGPEISIVTADADGQHLPEDILHVARVLEEKNSRGLPEKSGKNGHDRRNAVPEEKNRQSLPERENAAGTETSGKTSLKPALVLGVRDFSGQQVPARSRFGNRITALFFRLSTGQACRDTQTGLRGIPAALLPLALSTEGDRYEYEMHFLTDAAGQAELVQIPIRTVYEDNNQVSHFRPVRDSLLIYGRPLRFTAVAASSAAVDWGLFILILRVLGGSAFTAGDAGASGLAAVLARIGSGVYNFTLNRRWSFRSSGHAGKEAVRYLILFGANMFCSAGAVTVFSLAGIPAAPGKFAADVILFFVNYYMQKRWVFGEKIRD